MRVVVCFYLVLCFIVGHNCTGQDHLILHALSHNCLFDEVRVI